MEARRRVQVVSTRADRKKVILWMLNEVETCGTETRIAVKAVDAHPRIFSQRSRVANRQKARRWWAIREEFIQELENPATSALWLTSRLKHGAASKRMAVKAKVGRGPKLAEWKLTLHGAMQDEFRRMRSAGVKVNHGVILEMAYHLLHDPNVPVSVAAIEDQTGKPVVEVITKNFVTAFCNRYRIVVRRRTGNMSLGPAATARMHRHIAYHLGEMSRAYADGLDESTVENFDETHMILDMTDGKVLDFSGTKRVTYSQVSSGRVGFTVGLRISGGVQSRIEFPMVFFQNDDENYPINGVPDNVAGVGYMSQRKGWVNRRVFAEYFSDGRFILPLSNNRERRLYIDDCHVHNTTPALTASTHVCRTQLRRFFNNCTTLIQPADQVLIRMFKALWRKKWELKRAQLMRNGDYTATGRLRNPGKHYYLRLVKETIDELNARTIGGISVARKSMIVCGLCKDIDGIWKREQLTSELQQIVADNLEYFNGALPEI